jgi:Predicted transcriptional regulators
MDSQPPATMDTDTAAGKFWALGQPLRLAVLRALIRAGHGGMTAGEIAALHGTRPNTLSTHLATLSAAGLILAQREGRNIRYSMDADGIRALLSYLLDDCCAGDPDLCAPAALARSRQP